MDTYFNGVFISFLIGLVKLAIGASTALSLKAINLKKLDLHYQPFQGNFTNREAGKSVWALLCLYLLFLAPMFSWLSVISSLLMLVYAWTNKPPTPEKIKEFQYKISTTEYSREQLVELDREMLHFFKNSKEPDSIQKQSAS